eukprot:TRINITY_DN28178_c0_g1_i1.p1 TRINITY_DN28178_c0_g1~~TRINITY_DN28178_c0_g1_i1.p1  ORF type:complete len:454 (-),score=72.20 TRINITY_DN28178_c0_g1_i1:206-1567(-)
MAAIFCCAPRLAEEYKDDPECHGQSDLPLFCLDRPGPAGAAITTKVGSELPVLEDLKVGVEERSRQLVADAGGERAYYAGQWKGQKWHGYGTLERIGLGTYVGQFREDKATGSGRFTKLNGDIYDGQWREDMAHGRGTYLHADGSAYQGEWRDDLKDGEGIETWTDGSHYEGQYKKGTIHGRGIYKSADRAVYEGDFVMDSMEGQGRYLFPDGRIYDGQWVASRMSGEGLLVYPDGRQYEGQLQADRKHGHGKFTWPDGRSFEGQWLMGKQHGRGTYTDPAPRSWSGVWQDGQRMGNEGSLSLEDASTTGSLNKGGSRSDSRATSQPMSRDHSRRSTPRRVGASLAHIDSMRVDSFAPSLTNAQRQQAFTKAINGFSDKAQNGVLNSNSFSMVPNKMPNQQFGDPPPHDLIHRLQKDRGEAIRRGPIDRGGGRSAAEQSRLDAMVRGLNKGPR